MIHHDDASPSMLQHRVLRYTTPYQSNSAFRRTFATSTVDYFPLCRSVTFELVIFNVLFDVLEFPEVLDVAGVCGCWEDGCVPVPLDDGALETWKGANRIGEKDILAE
jgi:hypothetical protein